MKTEKIIICGGSGSGKDYLLKGLIAKGEKYEPKITTRPIRNGEANGVDYNYINNNDFLKLYEGNHIKAYQKFFINHKLWYYAVTNENFRNNNIFIMTPHELSFLTNEEREGCFVVYLDIPENIRRERILQRNDDNDSVERRLYSDRMDFMDFMDYDMKISDSEFEIDLVYEFWF